MKAAIYTRVSTYDGNQDFQRQLYELRSFAERLGYSVYKEYTDHESDEGERHRFKQLFLDAHQRRFDIVLFWSLDRFSCEGITETLDHLQKLSTVGVQFISFTEQCLDSTGLFKDTIMGVLAAIAKQEHVRHSERTKAGLAKALSKGIRVGRPSTSLELRRQVQQLKKTGISNRRIGEALKISATTVSKYLCD